MAVVSVDDKRIIRGASDINQMHPTKHTWAWKMYQAGLNNTWFPAEIAMGDDVAGYNKLTQAERHVYENVLAFLSTADISAARNTGITIAERITSPEVQNYIFLQSQQEGVHSLAYQIGIETIGLDPLDIYNRYKRVPQLAAKIQYAAHMMDKMAALPSGLPSDEDVKQLLYSYIFFAGVFEGCWFYNGFSPIFALQRRGLMRGTGEQLQYILRDEVNHTAFGLQVVKETLRENPSVKLSDAVVHSIFRDCEALERDYIEYILQSPIPGINTADYMGMYRFLANKRCRTIGVSDPFPGATMSLPWLGEQANIRKEKNFFESRVTEYQVGVDLNFDAAPAASVNDLVDWRR